MFTIGSGVILVVTVCTCQGLCSRASGLISHWEALGLAAETIHLLISVLTRLRELSAHLRLDTTILSLSLKRRKLMISAKKGSGAHVLAGC